VAIYPGGGRGSGFRGGLAKTSDPREPGTFVVEEGIDPLSIRPGLGTGSRIGAMKPSSISASRRWVILISAWVCLLLATGCERAVTSSEGSRSPQERHSAGGTPQATRAEFVGAVNDWCESKLPYLSELPTARKRVLRAVQAGEFNEPWVLEYVAALSEWNIGLGLLPDSVTRLAPLGDQEVSSYMYHQSVLLGLLRVVEESASDGRAAKVRALWKEATGWDRELAASASSLGLTECDWSGSKVVPG